ncbi:hypothetical protein TNIN_85841 [Trichonephila inaurata madagascariensis]|uniref:Uncharacterized protein n=1 Tax=Trichonephila inaurata madagascariensis TaxID=2747483 RepID=A0A8X6Y9V6_9ARAC|nr:hypothetical protein TNIN_85841 [Trichonephila inaurata madagascariensis]
METTPQQKSRDLVNMLVDIHEDIFYFDQFLNETDRGDTAILAKKEVSFHEFVPFGYYKYLTKVVIKYKKEKIMLGKD